MNDRAHIAGMIVMEQEAAFLNAASAMRQFMEGFGAGVAFGMVGGFIPGAVGSLTISIWRHHREQRIVSA